MSTKPSIVLVSGSWHNNHTWDKVAPLLETEGFKCIRSALPSASANPEATFEDDIIFVRKNITNETTQGRDVVVVVHSFGGVVGSSAIKGLTKPKDSSVASSDGTSGHVIGLFMIATGFIPSGVAFGDHLGGKPPPWWRVENGLVILTVDPREFFYHDLPEDEAKERVAQLEQNSNKALMEGGEHSYAGWMDVPVWFLATIEDRGLPIEAQRMMVQGVKAAGADVTLREIQTSHSPFFSKPKETVAFILEAVAAFTA